MSVVRVNVVEHKKNLEDNVSQGSDSSIPGQQHWGFVQQLNQVPDSLFASKLPLVFPFSSLTFHLRQAVRKSTPNPPYFQLYI